ncbi:MAG: hypothetical protein IT378_13795 [Sandaracinaceae bacterium]|nr:hypothetical protein [Sandaracinaceae bacterium]
MRGWTWCMLGASWVGAGAGVVGCGAPAPPPVEVAADPEPAPAGPVTASGGTEVRAHVAQAGGTLSLANGARIAIAAIDSPAEVVLRVGADARAFSNPETQRPLGPVLTIEPAIVGEITISIPQVPMPSGFSSSDLAFAIEEVAQGRAIDTIGTQTRWQFHPVQIEDGRFVARVGGLAGHRVQFGVAR